MFFVSRAGENDQTSLLGKCLLLLVSFWIAIYVAVRSIEQRMTFGVALPACDECSKEVKPEARHVDFQNAYAIVVVHRMLADAITSK
jgi:hypothetical protein